MTHASSLRVIGQKLELARISLFQLEHDGQNYIITSDSMSRTAEWLLRYITSESDFSILRRIGDKKPVDMQPIIFSDIDLTRLEGLEAKRRRQLLASQTEPELKLSHSLRALGDYLDRSSARTFCIFWMPDSVVIDYKRADGFTDRLRATRARLDQIVGTQWSIMVRRRQHEL